MFQLFKKNPIKKLNDEYSLLLKKAVDAQRNGNIELYSELSTKADKILKQIEKIENENLNNNQGK